MIQLIKSQHDDTRKSTVNALPYLSPFEVCSWQGAMQIRLRVSSCWL